MSNPNPGVTLGQGISAATQGLNRTIYLGVVANVRAGKLTEAQGGAMLKKAGFPDHENPYTNAGASVGGALHEVGHAVGVSRADNIRAVPVGPDEYKARTGHYPKTVAGTVALGTGVGAQALATLGQQAVYAPAGVEQAIVHPERTAKQLYKIGKETVTDPLGHPANALLLGWAGLSGLGVAGSRLAAAGRAIREGEGVKAAATRSSAAGGSLLHSPEPGVATIHVPGPRPEPVTPVPRPQVDVKKAQARLDQLETARAKAIDQIAAAKYGPAPKAEVSYRNRRNAVAARQAAGEGGASVYRPSAIRGVKDEQRALVEKDIAAAVESNPDSPVAKAWQKRETEIESLRSQLYKEPSFGLPRGTTMGTVAEGPRNAVPVDRILSRNPIARPFQRGRAARIQKAVLKETSTPRTAVGRAVRGSFSAQNTVGREFRASRRVEDALSSAARKAQEHAVHPIGTGLTRGEHTAVGVVGIEGHNAFTNPGEVIARHIATHQHFANLGGDVAENEARIADLKLAQHALENPSKQFKKAVALTRQLSNKDEQKLIEAGHLDKATAEGRRNTIAQIYGHEKAPEGGFFFSLSPRYTQEALHGAPGAFTPRPGQYGLGPAQARVPGLHQHFGGESVAGAQFPTDVASTVADRSARIGRALSAEKEIDRLWNIAKPVRQSSFDVPIRNSKQIRTELRNFFRDITDRIHASPDEMARLDHAELTKLTDMLSANEHAGAGIGASIPGVRWVDRRYLTNMGETNVRGVVEKLADAINNPIRTADIYASPAYALNLVGNLGMAGISQGVRTFPALQRAVVASVKDGAENTALIDSGMGASLSRSYSVPTGPLHQMNQRLAEGWNVLTDLYARRGAFYQEAARAGYKTPEQIHSLLHDPALKRKAVEVFRRANKNLVDYGSLTPIEQNTIRRLIYFAPWVSRGTIWALRTLVENPGKTFTLAQLGQVGAQHVHDSFPGGLAHWADEQGLIPVGKQHGDLMKVINLSSINTYQTAESTIKAAANTVKGALGFKTSASSGLGGMLTPAATILAQESGADTAGQPGGLLGAVEGTPQYQALRRAGLVGKPPASYPQTGVAASVGPYLGHGAYPRGLSVSAMHKSAVKALPPDQRAAAHVEDDRKKLYTDAAKIGLKLPPAVKRIYGIQAQRKSAYASLGSKPTQQEKLAADLKLAVKLGGLTPKDAAEFNANAKDATDAEIQKVRRQINETFFGGKSLSEIRRFVNQSRAAQSAQPATSAAP